MRPQISLKKRDNKPVIESEKDLPFPRYVRGGTCLRCGWCCDHEDCQHLVYNISTRRATCLIWRKKERPLYCGIYPGNPPILHSECGYYFIDRWENNRKIKAGEPIQ
jgi:hypothetical protein